MSPRRLSPGKVPAPVLRTLLADLDDAPDVRVGPGVGLDGAVVDAPGGALAVAGDPITFAAEEIGWYAVHVNANDVACMGGIPRWFLATVLLPGEATEALAREIQGQMSRALRGLGAVLVGGHTEVTPGIGRPVVAGTMLGPAPRPVSAAAARPGDVLLLSGAAAIEATALVARERGDDLAGTLPEETLERARGFLHDPGISVVPAAAAAVEAGARALHDPTEGGILHGIRELCVASGTGVVVDVGAVDVRPETRAVCEPFGIDPLGALGSGALLAAAPDDVADELAPPGGGGPLFRRIGRLAPDDEGLALEEPGGERRPFPAYDGDEIARIF